LFLSPRQHRPGIARYGKRFAVLKVALNPALGFAGAHGKQCRAHENSDACATVTETP
jgi:hypothetical protein